MYLKVNKDNEIIASIPKGTKPKIVENFILENISKFDKYVRKANKKVLISIKNNFIYLFGKKYQLKYIDKVVKPSVRKQGNQLWVLTNDNNETEILETLNNFLLKELEKYLKTSQKKWETKMKVPAHQIVVAFKATSWGTNNLELQKISYSGFLAHYPRKIINYVIVHELIHFFEPNHSSAFWELVQTYVPDFEKHRAFLRKDNHFDKEY